MGECSQRVPTSGSDSENSGLGSCEADYVSGSPQEDCCVSKGTLGENKSSTEEGRIVSPLRI
jgi:hypothetical protein